jgi:hypothetical protein
MSAAVLAQKLLYEGGSFRGPADNPLFLPWVRDVDLVNLLAIDSQDDPRNAILSSEAVARISREYLTRRYLQAHRSRQPHPAGAQRIQLGLAMANLNGVDYAIETKGASRFGYTRFQDQFIRTLSVARDEDDTFEVWDPIRQAALACGAFPLAFSIRDLLRTRDEYAENATGCRPGLTYAYTDGGLFQNEPLGMAKNLVERVAEERWETESRFYLYTAPFAKVSAGDRTFRAADATLLATMLRIPAAIFGQAQFQDWVMVEKVNDRLLSFSRQANRLLEAMLTGSLSAESLVPATNALLDVFFSQDPNWRGYERERLRLQFRDEYQALVAERGEVTADCWIDAILVLEESADLGRKEQMAVYTITAEKDDLAGELFRSFGGFFDVSLRQNDYDVGRRNARRWLQSDEQTRPLGPIRYAPTDEIPPPKNGLGTTRMRDLDWNSRANLMSRLDQRADELLSQAGVPGLLRYVLRSAVLSDRLKKLLEM